MKPETREAIEIEQARQLAKFGDQTSKPDSLWLAILVEEVGEIAKAMIERSRHQPDTVSKELIQAVAVGASWLDAIEERGE